MKKLAFLLVAAVIFVSLFSLFPAYASDHKVTVAYSGETHVKAGCGYSYQYTVTAAQINTLHLDSHYSGTKLSSCDIEILTYENKDAVKTGKLFINISESANPGDTITITADGRYSWIGEDPTAAYYADVKSPLILTVVADETPTPEPTPAPIPSASIPAETPQPADEPSAVPAPTAAAKTASHAANPLQSAAPAASASPAVSEDHVRYAPAAMSITSAKDVSPQPTIAADPLSMQLDAMAYGGKVSYPMQSPAVLTAVMLESLKAKQGVLVVSMDGYFWTVDGAALGNRISGSVNLDMKMTSDAEISEAAQGHDLYQLFFSQTDDFPGRFSCRFAALLNKPGDTLCLYIYHASSGLAEYKQSAVVDDDGYAAFDIYEGGRYFVTLPDAVNPSADDRTVKEFKASDGDMWSIVISALCGVGAAVLLLAALHRNGILTIKRRRKN